MRRAQNVVIDCHIDDVFAFLADLRNAPRWASGITSAAQVAGDGAGLGALYDVVRRVRGRRRHTAMVCVAWEPPRRVAWSGDSVEISCNLEQVWTASRVTVRGAAARDLRGLRRVLETGN